MTLKRLRLALALAAIFCASTLARASDCYTPPGSNQCYPTQILVNPATGQPYAASTGGSSGAGYTGASATAPGTSGSSATPVQGVANGVPLIVTWSGQSVSISNFPTTQAVSGTVTANIGTTNGLALDASIQSVKTTLGSPFQAGGSIGNTAFGISGTLPAFAANPTFNQGAPAAVANAWAVYLAQGGAALSSTNGLPTTDTNASQTITAPGTGAAKVQGVQGVSGGLAVPVSGAFFQPTQPVSGTFFQATQPVSQADGADVTLGSKADAANAATGSTAMAIFRQLHADLLASTPASVSTAAPTGYTTGTTQPLSLTTNGALRVDLSAASSGTSQLGGVVLLGQYNSALQSYTSGFNQGVTISKRGHLMTDETGSDDPLAGITPVVTQAGTAAVGKAAQGNLYSAYAVNQTTTAGYLVLINAAAAPASGAAITPLDVATLGGTAGATAALNYGAGPPNGYSAGIVALITTSLTTYTPGGNAFIQVRAR